MNKKKTYIEFDSTFFEKSYLPKRLRVSSYKRAGLYSIPYKGSESALSARVECIRINSREGGKD